MAKSKQHDEVLEALREEKTLRPRGRLALQWLQSEFQLRAQLGHNELTNDQKHEATATLVEWLKEDAPTNWSIDEWIMEVVRRIVAAVDAVEDDAAVAPTTKAKSKKS